MIMRSVTSPVIVPTATRVSQSTRSSPNEGSNADRVSIGSNSTSSESTIGPPAPKKEEKPAPLKLTAGDLKRPLKSAYWREAISAIDPKVDFQSLVEDLLKVDPAAASSESFELSQSGGSGWKSVDLKAVRTLSHGKVTTTCRLHASDGAESHRGVSMDYLSDELPTVQQLPEAMQQRWSETFGGSPETMTERVEEKLGSLGTKSKFMVYMGPGEGKYGSFHFKAGSARQPLSVRVTKDSANLQTDLDTTELETGSGLPKALQKVWNEWGLTPKGLGRRMLSGSGVHADTMRAGINLKGDSSGPTIALDLKGDEKKDSAGYFIFSFFKEGNAPHAYHDLLTLKDSFQGKDNAKTVLRNNFRLYDELGMDHVDLTAAITVGGYAWARYGWQLKDGGHKSINKQISTRLKKLDIDPSLKKTVRKLLRSENPKKLWAISDMRQKVVKDGKETTLGKALLLGTNWQGTFDLKDPASRQRLEHYIGV